MSAGRTPSETPRPASAHSGHGQPSPGRNGRRGGGPRLWSRERAATSTQATPGALSAHCAAGARLGRRAASFAAGLSRPRSAAGRRRGWRRREPPAGSRPQGGHDQAGSGGRRRGARRLLPFYRQGFLRAAAVADHGRPRVYAAIPLLGARALPREPSSRTLHSPRALSHTALLRRGLRLRCRDEGQVWDRPAHGGSRRGTTRRRAGARLHTPLQSPSISLHTASHSPPGAAPALLTMPRISVRGACELHGVWLR